jgi:hypothetical protein
MTENTSGSHQRYRGRLLRAGSIAGWTVLILDDAIGYGR